MASCKFNWEILGKILCIALLLLQGAVLDYYLIVKKSSSSFGFIATDIVVLTVWIIIVFIANAHCNVWMKLRHPKCPNLKLVWKNRRTFHPVESFHCKEYPDELPYAFIAWFAYTAITLVPEVAVIFKDYHADQLEDVKIFHQNVLKIALCITPVLFLFLVSSQHSTNHQSSRKWYVDKITGGVTLDLMDSIDFLGLLFIKDIALQIPEALENAIIAFACINFFLPTLALLELSVNMFDGQVRPVSFQVLYSMSYILLVNVPFFVIRMVLWLVYNQDVSVFIAKNLIMMIIYAMDIKESLGPSKPMKCPTCNKSFMPMYLEKHKAEFHLGDMEQNDDAELQSRGEGGGEGGGEHEKMAAE